MRANREVSAQDVWRLSAEKGTCLLGKWKWAAVCYPQLLFPVSCEETWSTEKFPIILFSFQGLMLQDYIEVSSWQWCAKQKCFRIGSQKWEKHGGCSINTGNGVMQLCTSLATSILFLSESAHESANPPRLLVRCFVKEAGRKLYPFPWAHCTVFSTKRSM